MSWRKADTRAGLNENNEKLIHMFKLRNKQQVATVQKFTVQKRFKISWYESSRRSTKWAQKFKVPNKLIEECKAGKAHKKVGQRTVEMALLSCDERWCCANVHGLIFASTNFHQMMHIKIPLQAATCCNEQWRCTMLHPCLCADLSQR